MECRRDDDDRIVRNHMGLLEELEYDPDVIYN